MFEESDGLVKLLEKWNSKLSLQLGLGVEVLLMTEGRGAERMFLASSSLDDCCLASSRSKR